ncbi:hypothetical protein BR93DRAFT_473470 [Coniochaeta sp. PMI_546]|nr:hypothetical protein BR93DRAFT_473470 [Coniochaeta sp. PMI_546]
MRYPSGPIYVGLHPAAMLILHVNILLQRCICMQTSGDIPNLVPIHFLADRWSGGGRWIVSRYGHCSTPQSIAVRVHVHVHVLVRDTDIDTQSTCTCPSGCARRCWGPISRRKHPCFVTNLSCCLALTVPS